MKFINKNEENEEIEKLDIACKLSDDQINTILNTTYLVNKPKDKKHPECNSEKIEVKGKDLTKTQLREVVNKIINIDNAI